MAKCPCCGSDVPDKNTFVVDLNTNTISYQGKRVRSMSRVIELAAILAKRAPAVVSFDAAIQQLYGVHEPKDPKKLVAVYASILRAVLEPLDLTVICHRGRGYRLASIVERSEECRSQ